MPLSQDSAEPMLKRPRRLRAHDWSRRMVRENALHVEDLIWPLFIQDSDDACTPIASMPGVDRLSIDECVRAAEKAMQLGIPCLALFPNTQAHLRKDDGQESLNPDNLVCKTLRAIKEAVPQIGLMADVALDPYTSHGHDGLVKDSVILNDETVEMLALQALTLADAGADIVAPSDMMDGRVGAIRRALEAHGYKDTMIMSYAAKYASSFYGPFRDAIGTTTTLRGDKRSYQMDPANSAEALLEAQLDIDEGADMLLVKPGLPYLDIVTKLSDTSNAPVFAYQVSGEYAMIQAAALNGWIDGDKAMLESLIAFKRAGARGVLTYAAPRVAELLRNA